MATKLTWDDLLIQNISESDARTWLGYWAGMVGGRVAPVFMSKFGDWFLRRPDGGTDELSVIEGTYSRVASTPEEFASLVNTQAWQEKHLLSFQVAQLHERGTIPGPGQCYAFAPHPAFSGRIDIERVMLMDIGVWQHICAQVFASTGSEGKTSHEHDRMNTGEHPLREWLKFKTSIDDAEAAMRAEVEKFSVQMSPTWLSRWESFRAQLQPSDELWYYEHFPRPLSGGAGYCIIRQGVIIASITTRRA